MKGLLFLPWIFSFHLNTCGWIMSETGLEYSLDLTYASAFFSGWLSTCGYKGVKPFIKTLQMYFKESFKGDQIQLYISCQGRKLDARALLLEVWSKKIQGTGSGSQTNSAWNLFYSEKN